MDKINIKLDIPLKAICTCEACPEQYEVMLNGVEVGYLRLRHGWFYASCPSVGGEIVYEADTIESDGAFTDEERKIHLPAALVAIGNWIIENRKDLL